MEYLSSLMSYEAQKLMNALPSPPPPFSLSALSSSLLCLPLIWPLPPLFARSMPSPLSPFSALPTSFSLPPLLPSMPSPHSSLPSTPLLYLLPPPCHPLSSSPLYPPLSSPSMYSHYLPSPPPSIPSSPSLPSLSHLSRCLLLTSGSGNEARSFITLI